MEDEVRRWGHGRARFYGHGMDINQLTSSVDQRLLSSGKIYRTPGQQE